MNTYNQKQLTDALDLASRQYYNGLQSQFTDSEFDLLLIELQRMEAESGVIYPNSPTVRVGSDIQSGFAKGKHPKPMYTIENVYDDEGLEKWIDKMEKEYGVKEYNISTKYDGISCELHYVDGIFVQGLTRGDKLVGDDITENVKTIRSVPMVLEKKSDFYEHDFYVRGEILLPKSKLEEINKERIENGEVPFSNTRNACSGSIKQLDPKVTAKRGLMFRAWDCFGDVEFRDMDIKTGILQDAGFYYDPFTVPITAYGKEQVLYWVKMMKQCLADNKFVDFDYDGIVVKVNSISIQDEIGTKDTRAIEWAIARKWNEEYIVNTKLIGVDWQVGRTGVLTPVGRLEPIECAGVIISNVTLNNMDFINSLGICIGDTLKITRSGGVIPYVLGAEHNGDANVAVVAPTVCPECGKPVVKDGALLKCTNEQCPAVEKGKILQFCSKDCMDIRSIGESVVEDLYESGLVIWVSDLYKLKNCGINHIVSELGSGYGKKKVEKILDEIEKSKKQPWERVLSGLSIPGVGKVVARTLARKYSLDELLSITKSELSEIDGIGDKMSEDIVNWFKKDENFHLCLILRGFGLEMSNIPIVEDTGLETPLSGLNVCFTGSSFRFKGDDVEAFLERNGAKCIHGVNKKLNYLITGDKPGGSKVARANELGIEIIGEQDFYNKYGL